MPDIRVTVYIRDSGLRRLRLDRSSFNQSWTLTLPSLFQQASAVRSVNLITMYALFSDSLGPDHRQDTQRMVSSTTH